MGNKMWISQNAPLICLSCRLFNGLNGVKIENQGKISMLVFFNVSEEDYGNYTCVAMNKMGVTNASIILYGKWMHSLCFKCNQTTSVKANQ